MVLRSLFFSLLLSVISVAKAQNISGYNYSINKNIVANKAAVVCAHPLAAKVGVAILKQGGNAVDAAIATQLALAVVYPTAGNIGGGGFMVAHLSNGKNFTLDFRETAPAAAYRDMFLDRNGNPKTDLSLNGHLSVGVPGTVAGLFAALKYAKLPFKKLIQPAIDLAKNGYAITKREAEGLNKNRADFISYNFNPTVFVKENIWKEGDTLIQKDLAQTLIRIRDKGAKGFYEGETANLIVAEMQRGKGFITLQDLKNYKVKQRVPLSFSYKNSYTILSMPLPSSGGLLLAQMMKMVAQRGIDTMQFGTAESIQLMIEAERRAYADRSKYPGDPDFVSVPVSTLISDKYLKNRMQDFIPGKAGNSVTTQAGSIPYESNETTHLSIMDGSGNAVSVTTTLNNSYGSKTVVSGAGFILNDEMDDFSIKPGVANLYGAVGAAANAIAPGKRMLSSMTPAIVLRNNKIFLVTGTPGGTTIPTSVFQTLVNVLSFNMPLDEAVNKPKFHHQWLPDRVDVEADFPQTLQDSLKNMGYKINVLPAIGRVESILILQNKKLHAVADKRGDDNAEGF